MVPFTVNEFQSIMNKLSLLDLGFFVAESEASPKHVGGLLICTPPAKSGAAFAKSLYQDYLGFTEVKAPFNRVIHFSLSAMPHWKTIGKVDLSEHIFYHKMRPGHNDRHALYNLVSKLHTPMLDRSRPLWELHVIDGLENGRFALYQKMHHAYADGVTMVRWTAQNMSESADDMNLTPVWTRQLGGYGGSHKKHSQEMMQSLLKEVGGTAMHPLHRQPHCTDLPGWRLAPLPERPGRGVEAPDHHPDARQLAPGGRKNCWQQDRHYSGGTLAADRRPVLRNIGFSLRNVRTDSVAPEGIESYTLITGLVAQIAEMLQQHAAAHGQHPGLQRTRPQEFPVHQRRQDGGDASVSCHRATCSISPCSATAICISA
jgi:hypothetical protein